MYEEGNRKLSINWPSLIIKLVLVVLIIFVAFWIYVRVSNNTNSNTLADNSDYITNITAMKTAAFEYFTSSKLPENIGESSKVTLGSMINQKLLIDFTNDGETCDLDESYIQATKTADGNYALKVSLTCGEKSDFIVTTIETDSNTGSCTTADASTTSSDVVVDSTETEDTTSSSSSDSSTSNSTSGSTSSSGSSSSSSSSGSSSNSSSGTTKTTTSGSSSTTTTTTTVTTTVKTTVNIKISGSCSTSCCTSSCSSNTTTSNNTCTTTNPCEDKTEQTTKTRYYKYVKYSDWTEGYLEGAENKEVTTTTATYCKIKTKTYYTTSYLNYQSSALSYSYTYPLDLTTSNADNVSITHYAYFTTSDYQTFLNQSNWVLYSTSGVATNSISITSATSFEASSLKRTNFTFTVATNGTSNNYYTTSINVNYLNGICVTPYYTGTCNNCVYFAPVKFTVKYTDLTDCVTDETSNAYKYYSGYTTYDTTTTSTWYHRTATYTWSTETSLEGYTYTGIYEDR